MKKVTISHEEFADITAQLLGSYFAMDMQFAMRCAVVMKELSDVLFADERKERIKNER